MVIDPLSKKLFRDLLDLKSQILSIGLIVGLGISVFFGFTTTFESMKSSRDLFYTTYNFSDLFVPLKKAPFYMLNRIKELDGVAQVEARITQEALLSIKGFSDTGLVSFVSIPDGKQPQINKIYLHRGRLPDVNANDEVVVSENFFKAHNLKLEDTFFATMNGYKKSFRIVGVGVSPEYIIAMQPGSPFPDDKHYVVAWVNQSVLETSYDMRSSFNNLLVKLKSGFIENKVISEIDNILDKYGVIGAYGRDKQLSNVYLREELKQLQVQATTLPIIFFFVAAFILNVVVTRLINTHRSEIATLKAIGYFDVTISKYYFKIASVIVLLGTLLGIILGMWIGKSMINLYLEFYHIPIMKYSYNYLHILTSILIALATAFIGVYSSLERIFKLQPAEAMRPPNPPNFQHGFLEKIAFLSELKIKARMVIRTLFYNSTRSLLTGLGMSFSIVLLISGLFWHDSIDYLMMAQYSFVQKEAGTIELTHAVGTRSISEVMRLPGVTQAEGYRIVSAKAKFQNKVQNTSIKGMPNISRLQGIINEKLDNVYLPSSGIFISQLLANQLGVKVGDTIDINILEGRKPQIQLYVSKIIDSFMSNEIYTTRKYLAELMKTDDLVNKILFKSIGDNQILYTSLKEKPNVLAVNFRESAIKMFNETSVKFLLYFALILSFFAGAIGFGVTYNNMRVTLAERDWELATMRILGFKISEVYTIILSEILIIFILFITVVWILVYFFSKWLNEKMSMD
ncbi:MAG: FtsX-like permease family protein, partial [Bdellovibrionales bacterium]|nr:FtsX-like permease family protein [Bdellovibrionales bacterium]